MVDMVWARPSNTFVTSKFQKIAEQVYNFDLRPDDVFMITFPKAGSTWTQVDNCVFATIAMVDGDYIVYYVGNALANC